jgi:hypothetical protein
MATKEQKPKVEGEKACQPYRAYKKDYTSAMAGLKEDVFDIGHSKYAAKYKRSVEAIARYVQQGVVHANVGQKVTPRRPLL